MTTIVTVETEGLPITKFKVGNKPKTLLISIDDKDGITFEDITNSVVKPKSETQTNNPTLDRSIGLSSSFSVEVHKYEDTDKKIGESKATAVGPGGVQSKFEYYENEQGEYYAVRMSSNRLSRYKLGRLDDPESKIAQVYQDTQRYEVGQPFIQTDIERSNTLPYAIKINRSVLKSCLEILTILGYLERVVDQDKISQKFMRKQITGLNKGVSE